MGSPVSVTVADLVMEDVEQRALSTYHSPPRFWKRYVDDTCTALPADQIQCFHDHLNLVEPTIQFTFETESEDTQITHHPDSDLSTTVYQKATHTDNSNSYLDFQSHHPLAHKAAVVQILFSRADNICSSLLEKGMEEEHVITHALKSNGYPAQFIRSQSKPTRRPRCAFEAWHIRSQKHPMNSEQGLLSQTYNSLIYSTSISCTSDSNYSPLSFFHTYKLSFLTPVCTTDDDLCIVIEMFGDQYFL